MSAWPARLAARLVRAYQVVAEAAAPAGVSIRAELF